MSFFFSLHVSLACVARGLTVTEHSTFVDVLEAWNWGHTTVQDTTDGPFVSNKVKFSIFVIAFDPPGT